MPERFKLFSITISSNTTQRKNGVIRVTDLDQLDRLSIQRSLKGHEPFTDDKPSSVSGYLEYKFTRDSDTKEYSREIFLLFECSFSRYISVEEIENFMLEVLNDIGVLVYFDIEVSPRRVLPPIKRLNRKS